MVTRPIDSRTLPLSFSTSKPFIRAAPAVGRIRLQRIFISVVFPRRSARGCRRPHPSRPKVYPVHGGDPSNCGPPTDEVAEALGTVNVFVSLQVSIAVSPMIPPPEDLCIKSQDHDNLISFISARLRGSLDLLFPPEKNLPLGLGLEPFCRICLMGTMNGSSDWDRTATSTL